MIIIWTALMFVSITYTIILQIEIRKISKLRERYVDEVDSMTRNNIAALKEIYQLKKLHSTYKIGYYKLKDSIHNVNSRKPANVRKKKVRGKKRRNG